VLRYECNRLGVDELCSQEVEEIQKLQDSFAIKTHDGEDLHSKKIIITTGGKASPQLGSDGSGFALAQKLGHTIIEPYPSLVQIKLDDDFLKHLKGIRSDARVSLYVNENLIDTQEGGNPVC